MALRSAAQIRLPILWRADTSRALAIIPTNGWRRFSTAKNRALFEADPEKYAPQFGGYCAYAVSQGYTASIDPEAFTLVDGKLYLNYSKDVMNEWLKDRDALIRQAEEKWPGLRDG